MRRLPAPGDLAIAGLVPYSTCDWPGRLVATVFLQGCPWQCTYCHNPALIDPRAAGRVDWPEVAELLSRRHGLLDGVVFSGGEPTRQLALGTAMRVVRAEGFGVGLHTGGAYPSRLRAVLEWVDWIGLDIKATPAQFERITRRPGSATPAYRSLDLVLEAGVDVQVRTTVDPTVMTEDDVHELSDYLAALGVREHVLQRVRPDGTTPEYAAALAEARPLAVG